MPDAIYGIGTDIIQIKCVEGVVQRTNGRSAEKMLGLDELRVYHARKACSERRGLAFLVTRLAVKEAVSKAIGLGTRWPVTWRAIRTLNLFSGQPVVRYSGEPVDWIVQHGLHIQISVADERDYAVAFAVAGLQMKSSA